MIFTQVNLKNMYCFKDTTVNLTYERKLKDNPIEGEYLKERPNFKFKRVCIISGANASGKTTFGRALCSIQNFIAHKTLSSDFLETINNDSEHASFSVEFATTNDLCLNRIDLTFTSKGEVVDLKYLKVKIGKNDSCKITRRKFDKIISDGKAFRGSTYIAFNIEKNTNKQVAISKQEFSSISFNISGWSYLFSENDKQYSKTIRFLNAHVLGSILKTFDSSIESVSEIIVQENTSKEPSIDGFSIKFKNGDPVLVDINSDVTGKDRLSRGTYDAIRLSEFVARVIADKDENTYFLDESLAYSHTEVEQAVINLMIEKLPPNSQLFYTTHNNDIFELNLPVHSFIFFRKDVYTSVIHPENDFHKSDRSILNHVRNDVFRTLPNTNYLDRLLFDDEN